MKWKEFLSTSKNRYELIITLVILSLVLTSLARFLNYVELRQGVVLDDPVLKLFDPINLTWLTFGLIYVCLIFVLIILSTQPLQLMIALQAYSLLVIFRIAAMYVVPLNPPINMIVLNDPFVQIFGTGKLLTKDLFFSGHTATLFLLFLVTEKKEFKILFLSCTIAVAAAVLLQHVHYTIDVIAAPFFAYSCFRIIYLFHKQKTIEL